MSFLALSLGLASCSKDFLELDPLTGRVEANSYNTEDDALKAVYAVYDSYQTMYNNDVVGMSEAFSDDAFAGGEKAHDFQQFEGSENTDFSPENSDVVGLYERCYQGIYRANLYLSKEEGITFTTPGLKASLHAEALFLRAYMYWDLVRHYGWVPLIDHVLPSTEAYAATPQSAPSVIYQQIATDLLEALPNLREVVPATETGRIRKAACQALIARIYLYHTGISKITGLGLEAEKWGNGTTTIDKAFVQAQLSDIISKGKYSLQSKYASVFAWDNQNNSESILEIQYSKLGLSGWSDVTQLNGNIFTLRCGIRRPRPSTDVAAGWSACVLSWDLVNAYGTDPRYSVSVFDAAKQLTSYQTSPAACYMNTGYFNAKYMPRTKYNSNLAGDMYLNYARNYIDIRYADVLLMAAELNVDGKGLDYFNLVHTRAGLPALTVLPDQEGIITERRLEFAGEGLRKWDLLRMGINYANVHCTQSFTSRPAGLANEDQFTGRVFHEDSWGMMPIPSKEIRNCNAGVLEQKIPYYINK